MHSRLSSKLKKSRDDTLLPREADRCSSGRLTPMAAECGGHMYEKRLAQVTSDQYNIFTGVLVAEPGLMFAGMQTHKHTRARRRGEEERGTPEEL